MAPCERKTSEKVFKCLIKFFKKSVVASVCYQLIIAETWRMQNGEKFRRLSDKGVQAWFGEKGEN